MGSNKLLFCRYRSNHLLRYYLKENKNVRRRPCSFRYGASGIPLAYTWQHSEKYVGTWMVLYQKSRYYYPSFHYCSLVPHGIWMGKRCLWHGRGTEQQYSGKDRFRNCMDLCTTWMDKGRRRLEDGCCSCYRPDRKRKCCCNLRYALWLC